MLITNVASDVEAVSNAASPDTAKTGADLNVALISSSLSDTATLSAAVTDNAQVIVYDAKTTDLAKIDALLAEVVNSAGGHKIDHLAILSHASSGFLSLDNALKLTADDVRNDPAPWQALGGLLSQAATIDLYGCRIASDDAGAALVSSIADLTGATVRASNDNTGTIAGADWDLEVKVGANDPGYLIDPSRVGNADLVMAMYTPNWNTTVDGVFYVDLYDLTLGETFTLSTAVTVNTYIVGSSGSDTITLENQTIAAAQIRVDGGAGNDTITISANSTVYLVYGGDGGDIITNSGTVYAIYGDAFSMTGSTGGIDTIEITNTGTVTDSIYGDAYAMTGGETGGADTITNSGTVYAIYGDAFSMTGGSTGGIDTIEITNSGTVTSNIYGDAYSMTGGAGGADTITNSGRVSGFIFGDAASIAGGATGGIDTIEIAATGTVTSNIYGDAYSMTGGAGGADTITNSGSVSYIYGDAQLMTSSTGGADTITNYGTVTMSIDAGTGSDTVNLYAILNNYAVIASADAGDTDHLYLYLTDYRVNGAAAAGSASIGQGPGGNTVSWTNFDRVHAYGTAGGDTITVALNATVYDVAGLAGNDTITNNGTVTDSIYGDAYSMTAGTGGADTITNSGTVTLRIYGDAYSMTGGATGGADTITNSGTVSYIFGDDYFMTGGTGGKDTFFLDGTGCIVNGGPGKNTFMVTGSSYTITGGPDGDSFTVSGNNNTVNAGTGASVFTLEGTATGNTLNGGAGADSFRVMDTASGNTLSGGPGDDLFEMKARTAGPNTFWGGPGFDTLVAWRSGAILPVGHAIERFIWLDPVDGGAPTDGGLPGTYAWDGSGLFFFFLTEPSVVGAYLPLIETLPASEPFAVFFITEHGVLAAAGVAGPATAAGLGAIGLPGLGEGPGLPPTGLTGLDNFYENIQAGKMLVFNLDYMNSMDLCTDCVLPFTSRPDIPAGLAGWYEAIKAGKTLVFNLSALNCMDILCGAGA